MREGNSPSMARASRLDGTGGVAGVASSKKNEIEHGLNGRDAPMVDSSRKDVWNNRPR